MKPIEYIMQIIILLHLYIVGLFKPEVAERARRMLFLTSLATTLAQEGIIKRNTLDVLNKNLNLAKNQNCLQLGEHLSERVWHQETRYTNLFKEGWDGKDIRYNENGKYLTLDDIRQLSPKVINNSPSWLRYDQKKMHQDVTDLFMTNAVLKTMVA